MRLYAANHSTKIQSSSITPSERLPGGVVRQMGNSGLCPFFTLQFGGLLDGAVLVEQLQHFLFVVEHFHHGVSGFSHLVHHQLTALHVTLRTNEQITTVAGEQHQNESEKGQRLNVNGF